jgi:hypothetical protein
MKFTISWIIFLVLILFTLTAWVGFEYYHKKNFVDVPADLVNESKEVLPTSFDRDTLTKLYEGKDKFYDSPDQTTQQ